MPYSANFPQHKSKYNYLFDLLKLALSIIIVCLHVDWKIIPNGYLSVEIFFIISGYFYVVSGNYKKGIIKSVFSILQRNYSKYAISIVLFFIIQLPIIYSFYDYFISFSMLQGTILKDGLINPPSWFICVMVWILPIFSLIKKIGKKQQLIILSLVSAASYACLFIASPNGGVNAVFEFNMFGITAGQLRCIGGLSLGCLLGVINCTIKRNQLALFCMIFCLIALLFLMNGEIHKPSSDFISIPVSALLIISLASLANPINSTTSKVFRYFTSTITVSIFLFHYPILLLITKFNINDNNLSVVAAVIMLSAFLGITLSWLPRQINKIQQAYINLLFRKTRI